MITLDLLKQHLNITESDDDVLLSAYLGSAVSHVESLLGYALDDAEEWPDGPPADLDQAVLMLAAHWYAQRETALVSTAAAALEVPFSVSSIVANYRTYSFG
jgi:uncharacterized phage protein (predicted DNA packaging)